MALERTIEGRELRLASRGSGRFLSAAFLTLWLCGWAVGEAVVVYFLVKGAIALITGQPPEPGRAPLEPGPTLLTGVFLFLWLSFWTFGGWAAMNEWLRLLFGLDRIVVSNGRLTVFRARGPFRTRRTFERGEIRRIHLVGREDRLALETTRGRVELSSLGTHAERFEGAQALRSELNLPEDEAIASGALPPAWEEIITPEGERALVANRATRRKQAWVAAIVAMALATVAFFVGRGAIHRPDLAIPAVVLLALTGLATAGAVWLARGRMEWRIGGGRLTQRKRFGPKVRDVFEAHALRIEKTTDSDGDVFFVLYALRDARADAATAAKQATWATSPGSAASVRVSVRWSSGPPSGAKTIARVQDDGATVRDLGAWLARATDVPLEDRSTPEMQAVDLAALKSQLEQSGPFGKWAVKLVNRLETAHGVPPADLPGSGDEPRRRAGP